MIRTAGIYVRLSREDKNKISREDDSESIINQRRMLLEYCRQNDIDVYDIYNDEDFSGSDRARPEFNRLIEDAKSGKINVVVCKTQSRFARDVETVERYINGLFPIWGVQFIGVVDNTDNTNAKTLKQRQISSLVDEWYIADLSENIRATFSSKRREGLWIGSFAPYGYEKDKNNKNKLVIDEEAAEVVRHIFSLYLSGMGVGAISRQLNDEGVLHPAAYKRKKYQTYHNPGGESCDIWRPYMVSRILANEAYVGSVVQGFTEMVSYKSTKKRIKKRSEWDIVENVHEPIISRDMFDRAQALKESRPRPLTYHYGGNLFTGKVRCATCGGRMKISYTQGKRYYRCMTNYHARGRCTGKSVSERVLSRVVLEELRKLYEQYVDENEAQRLINISTDFEKELSTVNTRINSALGELAQLDKRLQAIYVDKLDGVITQDEFLALKTRFAQERERVQRNISALESDAEAVKKKQKNSRSRMEMLREFKNVEELDFETVQMLIDRIDVDGDRNNRIINIYWNF